MKPAVHLVHCIGAYCAIFTKCGAAMQSGLDHWDSNVNYWGQTGYRKHKPITLLSFDKKYVTCKACLRLAE